jgi:hypothetical protein
LNDVRWYDDKLIGNNLEGSSHCLIEILHQDLAEGTEENHGRPQ